jgi:hypothetical protein
MASLVSFTLFDHLRDFLGADFLTGDFDLDLADVDVDLPDLDLAGGFFVAIAVCLTGCIASKSLPAILNLFLRSKLMSKGG